MVNEVMAQAITGIDDDLVCEAYNATGKKGSIKFLYTTASIAACIVLVLTAVLFAVPKAPAVFIDSNKLTSAPIEVSSPVSPASVTPRTLQDVTVNLDINLRKTETRISCTEGTFTLCGKNQDTLFFEGTDFTADKYIAKKDLSLYWTVKSPEENKTYTLTLEGKETQILTLQFDKDLNNWTIFIEK